MKLTVFINSVVQPSVLGFFQQQKTLVGICLSVGVKPLTCELLREKTHCQLNQQGDVLEKFKKILFI